MWQFAPICAQEPTVAQVSTMVFSPTCAPKIDEAGHQHHALGDVGAVAHHRAGNHADACIAETVFTPTGKFQRHLVESRRASGAKFHHHVVVEPERQQNRLLEPLVDLPAAVPSGSATRALPESSNSSASSTILRTSALAGVTVSRASKAASIAVSRSDMGLLAPLGLLICVAAPNRCRPARQVSCLRQKHSLEVTSR